MLNGLTVVLTFLLMFWFAPPLGVVKIVAILYSVLMICRCK
uniref:Uncharacterized protein n=1 Tax=Rhizophora mucronata TaxID=61149 RepID=A0A2P2NMV9_RHIMU